MRASDLIFVVLAAVGRAGAVEIPRDWRCRPGEESRFWKGQSAVPEKTGPDWGGSLDDQAPAPFVWLVIFENRDHDVAERRASIVDRWREFLPEEKCAYVNHYAARAFEMKREYDALVSWKEDRRLSAAIGKLEGSGVVAAQKGGNFSGWRERFELMRERLKEQGLRDETAGVERAGGVLVLLGRLKTERVEFLRASGFFEAKIRERFTEARADPAGLRGRLAAAFGARERTLGLLEEAETRERIVADLSDQLSRDPENAAILGSDFERRLFRSLEEQERLREGRKSGDRLKEIQRKRRESLARRKMSEEAVERLAGEYRKGKLVFPGTADANLLLGLEEYRRGTKGLYEFLESGEGGRVPGREELLEKHLELLREVCRIHYESIRYKPKLVKMLCDL